MADIRISGVVVRDCRVMESKYSGFCNLTHTRYQVGALIAYKPAADLTSEQKKAIFGTGKVYALTVLWNAQHNCPVAELGLRAEKNKIVNPVNFKPSEYQLRIKDAFLKGAGCHIEIKAYAGSGKTTSLVWLVQELCEIGAMPKDVVYLAFNKSIQEELAKRLEGTGCPAFTTHAFGLQALKAKFGDGIQIKPGRRIVLWKQVLCDEMGLAYSRESFSKVYESTEYKFTEAVKELAGLTKNWAIKPVWKGGHWVFEKAQQDQILELIKTYEIEWDKETLINNQPVSSEQIASWAMKLTAASIPAPNGTLGECDYDDMLYLARVLNLSYPKKSVVLTDESQDFNACQIEMLEVMVKNGSRVVFVGDPNQALYHFRGADSRAFERIGEMLKNHGDLSQLTLPKSYRGAQRIIKNAQKWVPDFDGERKEWGTVGCMSFGQMLGRLNNDQSDIALPDGIDGAMRSLEKCTFGVLCRVNLPLFIAAYQCLGQRKKVQIIGRSQIGEPLKRIIRELCDIKEVRGKGGTKLVFGPNHTDSISDKVDDDTREVVQRGLLSRLADWYGIQANKLTVEGYAKKLEKLEQDVACIEIVATNVQDNSVLSVLAEIDALVSDEPDPSAIQFSTVHRAKGLEWNVVFILRPDIMPHPYAKPNEDGSESEDQKVEKNCCYVAWTRPKDRLYFVTNWPFDGGANKELAFERPNDDLSCDEAEGVDEGGFTKTDIRKTPVYTGAPVTKGSFLQSLGNMQYGGDAESDTMRDMIQAEGGGGPVLTAEAWQAYQAHQAQKGGKGRY